MFVLKATATTTTLPRDISSHVTKVTLLSSYANFLLVMVPVSIVAGKLGWNPIAILTLNFIAIMPLAAIMSFTTKEISL
ncbi:Na-Ca-ex domain-containing protein [Fusarium keratoplasticum]|nr:Na-Ca-ex domain-containing protein [Fusarium keratoplasticum]